MVKTDAPFMSPPGCHHFNSPINVHYIVDRIAKEFGKSRLLRYVIKILLIF
jgi:Tat protein secretion system quality control protein TatD with DNase activity